MPTKIHMEALSPTMEEGQVVRWLKDEGEKVTAGEVLAEIETDKATMELVARGAGIVRKRFLEEGQVAPVGAVIGVIAGADEDISDILKEAPAGAGEPTHAGRADEPDETAPEPPAEDRTERPQVATGMQAAAEAPEARPTPAPEGVEPERAAGGGVEEVEARPDGRTKASPLARRLAEEAGLELERVRGSGPGGRVTRRDIEAALAAPAAAAEAPVAEVEEVPVSQMRKTIAKRLVTSIGPVPTFYLTVEVDAARLVELRARVNRRLEEQGQKTSLNDFIIKAVAMALRRHPEVNASWSDDVIRRYGRVHIGVAVAIEEGLITPVVRDADRKGIARIAAEVKELAGRARERKLAPDEYTGATFSVSNLGMFGIEEFTAIINPPEAAILAVGQVEDKPVAVNGECVVRPRMRMTMSCDHRVVDGATGAGFLQTLTEYLEEPMMMLA